VPVARDRAHRAPADAEHARRTLDRVMRFGGGVDGHGPIDAVGGRVTAEALEGALAGRAEGQQVRDRAAAAVDALHSAQAEHLGQPLQRQLLQKVERGVTVALRRGDARRGRRQCRRRDRTGGDERAEAGPRH
jgi:hypothetical protein